MTYHKLRILKSYIKGYIYDNPTKKKNSYYILKFNFSGMNINGNKSEEEVEKSFCNNVYSMFFSLSNQYYVYVEFPGGQGFVDILVEKSSVSRSTYEAVIELKYLNKEKAKVADYEKLKEEAILQMKIYMEDKRLNERENMKKYVIIFEGFDKYNIYEV